VEKDSQEGFPSALSQRCQTTLQGIQKTAFCVWADNAVEAVAESKVVGAKVGGAGRVAEAEASVHNSQAHKGRRLVRLHPCNRWSHIE